MSGLPGTNAWMQSSGRICDGDGRKCAFSLATHSGAPAKRAPRFGRIIKITSLVTRGFAYRSSYAAAKAALAGLTRTQGK
jgi:NAD(P)-dependent dehydrogenase (short-subunit alcohol dehydrogenase family)